MTHVRAQTFVVNYSLKYPHLQYMNIIVMSFYLNFKPSNRFYFFKL